MNWTSPKLKPSSLWNSIEKWNDKGMIRRKCLAKNKNLIKTCTQNVQSTHRLVTTQTTEFLKIETWVLAWQHICTKIGAIQRRSHGPCAGWQVVKRSIKKKNRKKQIDLYWRIWMKQAHKDPPTLVIKRCTLNSQWDAIDSYQKKKEPEDSKLWKECGTTRPLINC